MFNSKKKTIAIIEVNGPISASPSKSAISQDGFDLMAVMDFLSSFTRKNRKPDGILLRLNTPGGTAGASEELAEAILRVKEKWGIPVVASIADICCSGGYMVAVTADRIFANKQSLTGSIGTIMQIPNYRGLAEKLGVKAYTIKSGEMKDIGNGFRDMTQEEQEYLEGIASNGHLIFANFVLKHRKGIKNETTMMDGRPVSAVDAKENGLIDAYGTYNDAYEWLLKQIGADYGNVRDVRMKQKKGIIRRLFSSMAASILPSSLSGISLLAEIVRLRSITHHLAASPLEVGACKSPE